MKKIRELENIFDSKVKSLTAINRTSVKWLHSNGVGEYIGHEVSFVHSSVNFSCNQYSII